MRIVLADDHGLMLTGARLTLEADGFEIVGEAQSGPQVLPLVGRTQPDVVLLDLRMPGIDGLECLSRIRARHPEVKVVMCSMSNDADQIEGAFRRGACGYILKTIDPIDLGSAIRQAVHGTAFHALGLPAMKEDSATKAAGLSDREVEVLKAISSGRSNKAVAAELWVSVQTVKFHLTSIFRKLGVSNRTEAADWAHDKGLTYERAS